ncbi:MAG: 2-C-methyl-D-erythritol 4-phosphate cytidylyltransferase [Planctomycetes bacterium]|jgi:2-C-methyl-D-erythritol 4-phosphate cytidylyltransferase|nr:2-C-methyl-D-erythritol 4-phosphate cytidylyltransferase [Planctomycetota bacterium]MCL4730433.1 2-C-methyl-D-erythritol 4-phosphate cytidylyltransferase [Planctomycetota bacterium]
MADNPKTPDFSLVIVAGGSGSRMRNPTKKAFLELGGEPLVLQTARVFHGLPGIGMAVVVFPADEMAAQTGETGPVVDIRKPPRKAGQLVRDLAAAGVHRVVAGGARRQDSVLAGLRATDARLPFVMIHDAARPFVLPNELVNVMAKTRACGAAMLAMPVRDTLKRVRGDAIADNVDRADLWAAQTPQCFRRDALLAAFERHNARDVTDDAAMAALDGVVCHVVAGSGLNFKITTSEDLQLAEALLKAKNASAIFTRLPDSETIFDLGPGK